MRGRARSGRLAAALVACAAGCDALWSSVNQEQLDADVRELLVASRLSTAGRERSGLTCRMVGSTRDAVCTLRLLPGEIGLVAQGLGLERGVDTNAAVRTAERLEHASQRGCRTTPGFENPAHTITYVAAGRPRQLQLANGTAFEYALLYQRREGTDLCLQLSYASG